MRRCSTLLRGAPVLAAAALLACAPGGADAPAAGDADRAGTRVVFVTHGQAADPFWSVVSNGARAAGDDLGVRVEYQAPTTFDMVQMSNLIEAAAASRPSALVVSVPDADALGPAIRAATEAGIPVLTINSGAEASRALGAVAHVGQDERAAGRVAGERLAGSGARRVLCVNHEVGNAALDRRCDGLREAMVGAGGTVEVLSVDLADPDDTQQRVAGALRSDPTIRAVLTLGPAAAEPTLAALAASGRGDGVAYATFDLTPGVLEALQDGRVLFALDQQQYLQGYLPVVLLITYLETGAVPGAGETIRTGPGFVTQGDAARVVDLARRGIR